MFRPNFERPVPGVLKINLAVGTLIECPRSRTAIAKPPPSPGLHFPLRDAPAVVARIAVPRGGRRVPTDTRSGSALPGVEFAGRGAAAAVAVRDAWCAASDGLGGVAGVTGARGSARDPGVWDAARSDPACRDRGRRLRVLPDPLDRDQRDLGLSNDRRDRAFRRLAALVRTGQRRPADTGGHHRVSRLGSAGGPGPVWHSG